MDPEIEVGQKIVALRDTRRISQKELVERLSALGVTWSQATLSKVENGSRPIKFTEAVRLAEALGVLISELRPAGDALERLQQRAGWVLKQTADALDSAKWEYEDAIGRAHAVALARELSAGLQGPYTVNGSAKAFLRFVTTDSDDEQTTDINDVELLALIGVPKPRIDSALADLRQQITDYIDRGQTNPPDEWTGTDAEWLVKASTSTEGDFDLAEHIDMFTHILFDELHAEALVTDALPHVTFQELAEDDTTPKFTVDGIHNPVDDLERITRHA